jgi:D-3-phosphoglycerate dehydrogenase / 2-oxoglutarate reductase
MRWKMLNMADVAACPDVFAPLAGRVEVVSVPGNREALARLIGDFDFYCAAIGVPAGRAVLERATRLKAIVTASTGLDHIDLECAAARGIAVLSLRGETSFLDSITSTAELAFGLLLSVARRLPAASASAAGGAWSRERFRGHQLSGKTLGVLGYGRLGRMMAEYGKAFRMDVIACDVRPVTPAPCVKMVSFDQLLKRSDVLSIHIHLTPESRRLIDARAIARMKAGAILINTSRGAIVEEAAMLDALASGRLAGAGLDVIDGELTGGLGEHPVIRYARGCDNVVVTPHIGGVTCEAQAAAFGHMVTRFAGWLAAAYPEEA